MQIATNMQIATKPISWLTFYHAPIFTDIPFDFTRQRDWRPFSPVYFLFPVRE